MADNPAADTVADCLAGIHGPAGFDGCCVHCDEKIEGNATMMTNAAPYASQRWESTNNMPIDTMAVINQPCEYDGIEVPEPGSPESTVHSVLFMDGPLKGTQQYMPKKATVTYLASAVTNDDPITGTLWAPYTVQHCWYRIDTTGHAYLMPDRTTAP